MEGSIIQDMDLEDFFEFNPEDYREDFALGSFQYDCIYTIYNWCSKNSFESILDDDTPEQIAEHIYEYVYESFECNDKRWNENSCDTLKPYQNENPLKKLEGLFSVMRDSAWDLWGALNTSRLNIPDEIIEHISDLFGVSEETAHNGLSLWYLAKKFNLTDSQVKKIFRDFDT